MYDRRPADVSRKSHHLVSRTSRNWVPRTSGGRPHLEIFLFPLKNSNRCVKQGLLHLKNTFFIKSSIFVLFPKSPLKVTWRSQTLGPLEELHGTSLGRRVPGGSMLFKLDFANNSVLSCFFFFFLIIDFYINF